MSKVTAHGRTGRAMLGVSMLAMTMAAQSVAAQSTSAQSCPGVDGSVCEITVSGADQDVSTDGATHIVNSGAGTSITQNSNDYLLIENQAGATIDALTLLPQTASPAGGLNDTTIINRGAINGSLMFANGGVYVNDGGTVAGDLTVAHLNAIEGDANFGASFKTETFINRSAIGTTGVAGTIDPGNGVDFFIQSFSSTGTYALPATLPTHFEVGGVEALGTNTIVTVTSEPGQAHNGLSLYGDGNIVNNALINDISFSGTGLTAPVINFLDIRLPAVVYGGEVGNNHLLLVPTAGSPAPVNYGGALTSFTNEGTINGDLRLRTASFTNNDEINLSSRQAGTLIFGAADQNFTFTNRGTIEMVDTGIRAPDALTSTAVQLVSAIDATVLAAVNISNSGEIGGGLGFTGVASDFVFENSGTISMAGNPNGIDRAVDLEIGGLEVALNPAFQEDAAANSVTVTNNATGTLDGGIEVFANTRTFAFTNNGIINQDADDDQAEAVNIDVDDYANAAGEEDVIDAESASFVNAGAITGTVDLGVEASAVTINNSGTISRALTPGAALFAEGFSGLEVEQETTLGATLNFTNSGEISTTDYAGAGVSISVEAGDVGSGVAGADTANANVTFVNSGTIAASGGSYVTPGGFLGRPANEVMLDFAAGLAIDTDAEGASSISITNEAGGIITARGQAHLGLPGGAQIIAGQPANASGLAVAAHADAVTIVNNGTILGGPGGPLTLANGTVLVPMVDADVDFENVIGSAIDTFASTDDVTNGATGVIEGGIALRGGNDVLKNYGSITGDILFGAGDDSFTQGINATFAGTADGGEGTDRFLLDITGGGTINNAIYDQLVNFEVLGLTGTGSISSDEPLPVETIELTGDEPKTFDADAVIETQGPVAITGTGTSDTLTVLGTVNGDVDLGDGSNSFTLGGTVNGNIIFGSGSDALVLQPGATLTGTATGGEGFDSLSAPLTGTYEEPTILDLGQFESFEELNVTSGGIGAVEGDLAFETVNVDDGRLIGLTGSTISGDVNVSDGGTFGSAGTVNGDVGVEGTLSPGSSPGTMTVNGNVTLASGSTTEFEMTPTVSDALVINGSLTIETGTTLDITGERPLTPGVTYNLITTTDGITGSFTTINKEETVLGFISQTSTALQLLGTFQLHQGANAQVTATNSYLNSLLINGQATAGLLVAVPDLVGSDGFASDAALATIHPEAYASASQIGVENGLAISSALRSGNWAGRGSKAALFTFAQGFGSWRNFRAESGSGASKANVRSSGFFGGVGYGNKNVSVSAFIGRVDGTQSINSIGARNDADGTFFGATAELAIGGEASGVHGFRLGGSFVRDQSSADTRRVLFNGSKATSHYRLRGTTADVHAGYGFSIGGGWDLGPDVGVTHISIKRGDASETGGGAFNLNVAKDRISYTFLTADLALQRSEGVLRPWVSAGLRQRLDNDRVQATASLTGVSTSFTVPGVQRDRSFGNVGAGVAWQASSGLTLFARGNSEFGGDNNGQSGNLGLRLRF